MNNNCEIIDRYLKDSLKKIITDKVDEEIEKKIDEFKRQLVDRRNQYISEIMKGIQIKQLDYYSIITSSKKTLAS